MRTARSGAARAKAFSSELCSVAGTTGYRFQGAAAGPSTPPPLPKVGFRPDGEECQTARSNNFIGLIEGRPYGAIDPFAWSVRLMNAAAIHGDHMAAFVDVRSGSGLIATAVR